MKIRSTSCYPMKHFCWNSRRSLEDEKIDKDKGTSHSNLVINEHDDWFQMKSLSRKFTPGLMFALCVNERQLIRIFITLLRLQQQVLRWTSCNDLLNIDDAWRLKLNLLSLTLSNTCFKKQVDWKSHIHETLFGREDIKMQM